MTELERRTATAWAHIRQCGATVTKRGDALLPAYRALRKTGKVTIEGSIVRLAGEYRRAFLAGEDVPE